jgi:hypothetical protein
VVVEPPKGRTSATGTGTVQFDWTVTDGHYTPVLVNADGSRGIAADIRAATRIRISRRLASACSPVAWW